MSSGRHRLTTYDDIPVGGEPRDQANTPPLIVAIRVILPPVRAARLLTDQRVIDEDARHGVEVRCLPVLSAWLASVGELLEYRARTSERRLTSDNARLISHRLLHASHVTMRDKRPVLRRERDRAHIERLALENSADPCREDQALEE